MHTLSKALFATPVGIALAAVVSVDSAAAQYADDAAATGAGTTQQLTEAGLYGVGLLALVALVVALYVFAPRVKRSTK